MAKPRIEGDTRIALALAKAMEEHPHIKTQTALAAEANIAQSTVGRVLRGEAVPGAKNLEAMAKALGIGVEQLLGKQAGPGDLVAARPVMTWEHPDELPPGEFAMVARLAVKLSAGNGHEHVQAMPDTTLQPQAFRADWIRKMGLKPGALACLTADGDSMEPRIQHGDALVVDVSQREVVDGRVYALWYDGSERVKRLYRVPGGGLRIASDNPRHQTFDVPPSGLEHIHIIGRVVHVAGEGGL
jgi:phage repressor protein C with HTH and peptisase S24 domain